MTYEANVKLETELVDMFESLRADMLESEINFAHTRFGELKALIDQNSEYVAECAEELKTHLVGIKESL